ncbi:MAG: Ig-like domain-containing protein [Bacteroidota bacterium]
MKSFLFSILFALIGFTASAQSWQPLTYSPNQDSLELNPLKGLAPLYNVSNEFPHSLHGLVLGFDQVMFGPTTFDWTAIDTFITQQGDLGRFSIIQVNVDMGFNRSDLPAFLSNVPRFYYDGTDPEDGAGVPSMVVDYNNEELMTAMLTFIDSLGARYNDDQRVFIVHYGLYGIFGEWDLGFGKKFVPASWKMSPANQLRITDAYDAAFTNKNKRLVARFPENVPESQKVGYSDGLFFGGSVSDDPAFVWFFHPKLKQFNADLNWKNHPMGGEVDPDVQPIVWEQYPNDVIGLPGQLQNTDASFDSIRPTFLFQDYVFNDLSKTADPTEWDNALTATKRTGYTFYVNEYRLSASNAKPAIEVNIQNKGLAPMYAEWEVEFAYLDGNGQIQSLGRDANWNIKSIQPEVDNNYRSFVSDVSMPLNGTYTMMLRVVNPLETISSQAKPVRFANTTQDADEEGWLTLGQLSISGGNAGVFPTQVTDMSISQSSAVMGLDAQLQLSALVSPANATSPAITWSSNRPRTASVDENGLVQTYNLSGAVEITAYTQDGAIARVCNISVQSFWNIPRIVEAEGFSAVVNLPLIPQEAPANEGGGQVVGFLNDSSQLEYTVRTATDANFVLDFRAASPFGDFGAAIVNVLDENGDSLTTVAFSPSTKVDEVGKEFDNYATYRSDPIFLTAGEHRIIVDVVTSAFNLNWIEFKLDPCENFDPQLEGTACDDGNPDTEVDVYEACECVGIPLEAFTTIPAQIEAEDYYKGFKARRDIDAPVAEGGGKILAFLADDTYMDYPVFVNQGDEFVLDLRAASPTGDIGNAIIKILNDNGDSLTTVSLAPSTANDSTYARFTSDPFNLPTGYHSIRLDVVTSAFNLNWIEFRLNDQTGGCTPLSPEETFDNTTGAFMLSSGAFSSSQAVYERSFVG